MKKISLILLFFTFPFLSQAQFESVTTKTIDKLVKKIDKDTSLTITKRVNGDTTVGYLKHDAETVKMVEMIKTNFLRIKRHYYYDNGSLLFVLESKKLKANKRPVLALFGTSYYENGKRIYHTVTIHNRSEQKELWPTKNLHTIGMKYYSNSL